MTKRWMRPLMQRGMLAALAMLLGANAALGQTIETKAKQAILIDYDTGTVLYEKNADQLTPPASMSKMMTIYLLFEKLKKGEMSLADMLPVSETAWRMQGSKMFVAINSKVAISDLLRGIIVQSGNDACIVVAEAIAGSEENFAKLMTERGRQLGLTNSNFTNSNGWPDAQDISTVRDLAKLGMHLIHDFPEYYEVFSEKEFTYNKIRQGNRNPLLYRNIGADGLKTGHTDEAGYGLAASAKQGDRRLILVAHGMASMKERDDEAVKLMSWGFREFENRHLMRAGQPIEEAQVWLGEQARVSLTVPEDIFVTLPRSAGKSLKVRIEYTSPLPAPISQGQEVGRVIVEARDLHLEQPLVAAATVERRPFFGRITGAISHLVWGAAVD